MKKALLVIIDGLGDRPIAKLGYKTPLESASTPNLNKLAKNAICGIMDPIDVGITPGSDTAHLSIFGYDPHIYYHGRGPLEAAGVGIKLKQGDIAFRANFATLDKGIIIDRRAGRIESVTELASSLNGMKIRGVSILVTPGTAYRACVVLRGKNLSDKVSDYDPHKVGMPPQKIMSVQPSANARFTAKILQTFLDRAQKILANHEINKRRIKQGLLPANCLLTRGAGITYNLKPFKLQYNLTAACIAGACLYKGIARTLGMDILEVRGATGLPDTNVEAMVLAAHKALDNYDFVFLHIKAADSLGEDGNYLGKKRFIEKIDRAFKHMFKLDFKNTLLVITADHSTPCELKTHSGDPVPLMMIGAGVRSDNVNEFGERACARGNLHRIKGSDLMAEITNLLGIREKYGE